MMSSKSKSREEPVDGSTRSEGSTQEGNMSSPIAPTQGPTGPAPVDSTAAAGATTPAAPGTQPSAGAKPLGAPVSVETMPSAPPPEILAQMSGAAGAYERLAAAGQEVRFTPAASGRGATAELVDTQGNVLRTLSPSEAIALALDEADPQPGEPA